MKTIPLTRGLFALVDDEDHEAISAHNWCAVRTRTPGQFYAMRSGPRPARVKIWMHVVVNGTADGFLTDHRDGDGLNNRRSNLRTVTDQQNQRNHTRKRAGCGSPYRGVGWHGLRSKWVAYIRIDGKQRHLGLFDSEIDAAGAYDAAGIARDPEHFTPNFSASWLAPLLTIT
jgi:hypothetical protein